MLLSAFVLAAPPVPEIPDVFDTWITCNIVNKNYSVVVHEVFDAPNQRALLSSWHGGERDPEDPERGVSRTMYLFDLAEYVHVNETHCLGDSLNVVRFGPFARATRTPTSKELFDFAREGQLEEYMGVEVVEGVPCNHWRSVDARQAPMVMQLDYYFSVPEWRSAESNASEVPVMLRVRGHRPSYVTPGTNHTFDHYYAYNHFRVGQVSDWVDHQFHVPSRLAPCSGNLTEAAHAATEMAAEKLGEYCAARGCAAKEDHGQNFGFTVLGGVLALAVVAFCSICLGRKIGQHQFQPMVKEAAVTAVPDKGGVGKPAALEMAATPSAGDASDRRVV